MATFEERLLEFLDGEHASGAPLDESSREEFLREISESPEKRRIFTAHLKLRDLLNAGQKPSPAPLDVQRNLAEKLPMLALHLPYLARETKKERLAGFWTSNTSLIRIALVVGALAVGSGVWYVLSRDHSLQPASKSTSQSASQMMQSPNNDNTVPSQRSSGVTGSASDLSSNAPAASTAMHSSAVHHERPGVNTHASTVAEATTSDRTSHPRAVRSGRDVARTRTAADDIAGNGIAGARKPATKSTSPGFAQDENSGSEQSVTPVAQPPIEVIDRLPSRPPTERPKVSDINSVFTTLPLNEIKNEMLRKTSFWAEPQLRLLLLPKVTVIQPMTGAPIQSASGPTVRLAYWAGATRDLSNGWSGGFRVGYIPVVQMRSTTYSEPMPNYPLLVRYGREIVLKDTSAVVIAPQVSYTMPLAAGSASISTFGGVGLSEVNWLAGVHGAFEYPLTNAVSFQTALAFDVTSVKAATATDGMTINSYTSGVQNIQSEAKTLLTPTFGFSVGLSFRP
jgi:hypothetical protein